MAVVRPPARRDAPSAPSSRALRSRSRARGTAPRHVLTPRDHDILRWIGRYGVVSTEQVARRWFLPRRKATTTGPWTTSSAYHRVQDLEESGLLQRDQIYLRGPHILRLTLKGARIAGSGVRPAQLVPATVDHALAVVDLTERLLKETPGTTATTEREIRAQQVRARLSRRDEGDDGPALRRVPDAIVHLPTGGKVAVELDRTPKRSKEIERIADAYNRHFPEDFIRVWWYARTGRVVQRVRAIVRRTGYLRDDESDSGFIEVREWLG